ncbi:MAG: hypothetical protein AAFX09_09835 [Pseudomonadota bacterium]
MTFAAPSDGPPSPRPSRITPDDIRTIAFTLVERHGVQALGYADQAIAEMEAQSADDSAQAWRALRWEIADALDGRIERSDAITLH